MKLKLAWHIIHINKSEENMVAKYFTIPFSKLEEWPTFVIYSREPHIERLIRNYPGTNFSEKKL